LSSNARGIVGNHTEAEIILAPGQKFRVEAIYSDVDLARGVKADRYVVVRMVDDVPSISSPIVPPPTTVVAADTLDVSPAVALPADDEVSQLVQLIGDIADGPQGSRQERLASAISDVGTMRSTAPPSMADTYDDLYQKLEAALNTGGRMSDKGIDSTLDDLVRLRIDSIADDLNVDAAIYDNIAELDDAMARFVSAADELQTLADIDNVGLEFAIRERYEKAYATVHDRARVLWANTKHADTDIAERSIVRNLMFDTAQPIDRYGDYATETDTLFARYEELLNYRLAAGADDFDDAGVVAASVLSESDYSDDAIAAVALKARQALQDNDALTVLDDIAAPQRVDLQMVINAEPSEDVDVVFRRMAREARLVSGIRNRGFSVGHRQKLADQLIISRVKTRELMAELSPRARDPIQLPQVTYHPDSPVVTGGIALPDIFPTDGMKGGVGGRIHTKYRFPAAIFENHRHYLLSRGPGVDEYSAGGYRALRQRYADGQPLTD